MLNASVAHTVWRRHCDAGSAQAWYRTTHFNIINIPTLDRAPGMTLEFHSMDHVDLPVPGHFCQPNTLYSSSLFGKMLCCLPHGEAVQSREQEKAKRDGIPNLHLDKRVLV